MNDGTIVVCPDGKYSVTAERRGDNVVVIESDDKGLPYLDYYKVDELRIAPDDYTNDALVQFFDHYQAALQHSQSYRPRMDKAYGSPSFPATGGVSSSAPRTGLVPKRVTVRGKRGTYSAIRMVRVKAPKAKSARKQTETEREIKAPKQRLVVAWKDHLTPSVEEYKGVVSGDREALGKYVMRALWKPAVGEVETIKTVSFTQVVNDLAKRITGVRPEGFQPEDIMQEVAVRLMSMQDKGRFAENAVPREKFASFLAQTVRNTSLEILRKQRLDKFAAQDISDFADTIADVRTGPADTEMETREGTAKIRDTIKGSFSKLPTEQKIVLDQLVNNKPHLQIAKELRVTPDAVKGRAKRAYATILGNLKKEGFQVPADATGVTKLIRDVIKREYGRPGAFKAMIKLRGGRLLLKGKPAGVGEIRMQGGVKKKKVGPGKWVPVDGVPRVGPKAQPKTQPKKNGDKKKTAASSKGANFDKMKNALKDAIKGIVETMKDVYAGRGGGETAAATGQQVAADVKGMGAGSKAAGAAKPTAVPVKKKPKAQPKKTTVPVGKKSA